jgi:peptidoglycan hydrolase CwlO-like protein
MRMKSIYACLTALFLITIPVFAQDQSSNDERQPPSAGDVVAKIQSKLNLTQDQVTAITPIIEKYSAKREELRQSIEDGTADRDSVRSQMKQLKEDQKQELSQILSSDQLSQWEQMHSKMRPPKTESSLDNDGNNPPPNQE